MNILNVLCRCILPPKWYARFIGVKFGKNCLIATKNWSSEPFLIKIGNNVQITHNVSIHTHGGAHVARVTIPDFDVFGRVIIEDGAYVGSYSHIMPGVRIGKGSLVAAGSVVTKSVPDGIVVAGNPAKYICTVEEYIERNKKFNFRTKRLSQKNKKRVLLSADSSMFIVKPDITKL